MMSLINNLDQNRTGSTGFHPVVTNLAIETVEQRGQVLVSADDLLHMTLELLRMTIELLHLLRMTLDQIRRDIPAAYLKTCPQQL